MGPDASFPPQTTMGSTKMNAKTAAVRLVASLVALVALAAGCTDYGSTDVAPAPSAPATNGHQKVDCSHGGLGSDAEIRFQSAYYVVDGKLGDLCLGEKSRTLVDAWDLLATIAPGDALDNIGVFAGFSSKERGNEVSVAFVNRATDDGTVFQMSLNLEASVEDGDYLAVTLAHELSHVFTALPDQLTMSNFRIGSKSCDTYFNGDGCYTETSLMIDWIDTFWTAAMIEDVSVISEASADDGQARCNINGGFLGAYAASSPEEDFAESFGAYVLQVPARSPGQQERFDWFAARSDLARFRSAAAAAGIGPLDNEFDRCG